MLTNLIIPDNGAPYYLHCSNNLLSSLNISRNTVLKDINCNDNQLTSLNVSNKLDLQRLSCGGNQLSTLDISNNSRLQGTEYGKYCMLDITNMPNLQKVCVWTLPFPPVGFRLCSTGSPNVYFTTDCSK